MKVNYCFSPNMAETDCLPWMARMALASRGATDSCTIFLFSRDAADRGMVFSTTTSSSTESVMCELAAFEKRPCDAKANTRRATTQLQRALLPPCSLSWLAALQSVPAVSIMSSTMMQSESSMVPTRSIESI